MTRSTPVRRRTVLGAAVLASAALSAGLLAGCSAGQITGTDTQVAAVPGVNVSSADGMIALRDATVPYADVYKPGDTVPLQFAIVNNSRQAVKLTSATTQSGDVVLVGGPRAAASPSTSAAASPAETVPVTPAAPSGSRRPSGSATATATAPASPTATAPPTATASPTPSPTQVGSAQFSIDIATGNLIRLTPDTKPYLAVAKLTGNPLKAGEALAAMTLTFTYADGSSTTVSLPEVPMTPPLSPLPKPTSVVKEG